MAENPLLALVQNMLSGSTSVEETALLNLVYTRLLSGNWTISSAGLMGQTGVTDGQVLIGKTSDRSLNLATLTAGSGVTITNAAGSITVAATAGGTVTHTAGNLTANALVLGNAAADITVMASLGTTTTVLHGNASGVPTFGPVVEADITLAANTTNNVSTARHGFVPTLSNVATQYFDGTGNYSTPVGGLAPVYIAKVGTYTAVANDFVAATSGTFTVTLPAASSNANKMIWVVNNGTGTITIGRTGADTVGLATSQTLNPATATTQGDAMTFFSDGTSNWNIV